MSEQPIFAQITAPSTDPDAYLPLHPGAAAFSNGTQQSFMDEYSNWIYLTPMVLGGAATILAAAWKFLGLGSVEIHLEWMTAVAREIIASKLPSVFSLRIAMRLNSFNFPKTFSLRGRHL